MRLGAAALALVLFAAPVAATADPSPMELYNAGEYDAAIKAGQAAQSAMGYAAAARAELAKERLRPSPCLECLQRAEADARKAVAADPKLAIARVFLGAAIGYEARIVGTTQALSKGYGQEIKTNLDAALQADPNNPWALAAMGGWHIGVVNGGGAMLAGMIYGASVEKGLAYYDKAMAADPESIPIRFQYALSLSAYDRETYAKEIMAALKFTTTGKPRTAYEVLMQGQARDLLDRFQRGDWDAYDALVRKYQGYPD